MITPSQLVLLPRPRQLEVTPDGPPVTSRAVEQQSDALAAQGFELELSASGIMLRYRDEAGRRYARATLAQLRSQFTDRLPGVMIRDWPDFETRGYMLDVSRGRVPTRETLEHIVSLLELLRINHFQLYTEHTFAYAAHETVWRDASPLTPQDIQWLDQLCADAGIELSANQNSFGHFEQWLKHDAYRHRAELPEGFELFGKHRPATTLEPTQDNADFALGLLEELLPNFTSRGVNIGCDETWELGRGASLASVEERGKGRVYLDHLHRLANPLRDRGYDVYFWGDIIASHPELAAELPQDATAVAWWYEAPWTPDNRDRMVAQHGRRFAEAGVDMAGKLDGFSHEARPFLQSQYPLWLAPGTSTWNSLIGRLDNAYGNLLDTVEVGLNGNVPGILITDWGDNGHLQPPSVSFPPLTYGAAIAWCRDANRDLPVAAVLDRFVFDSTGLGGVLDVLGGAHARTGQLAFNASPLQLSLEPNPGVTIGEPDAEALQAVVAELDVALEALASPAHHNTVVGKELTAATRLARHGALRLLRQAGGGTGDEAVMRADLAEAIELHHAAWLKRSRPGGMAVGLSKLIKLAEGYRT